jgi:hypothetical protein
MDFVNSFPVSGEVPFLKRAAEIWLEAKQKVVPEVYSSFEIPRSPKKMRPLLTLQRIVERCIVEARGSGDADEAGAAATTARRRKVQMNRAYRDVPLSMRIDPALLL